MLSDIPPKWNGIPLIGLAGFLMAGVMGFWLLVSIIRHAECDVPLGEGSHRLDTNYSTMKKDVSFLFKHYINETNLLTQQATCFLVKPKH